MRRIQLHFTSVTKMEGRLQKDPLGTRLKLLGVHVPCKLRVEESFFFMTHGTRCQINDSMSLLIYASGVGRLFSVAGRGSLTMFACGMWNSFPPQLHVAEELFGW